MIIPEMKSIQLELIFNLIMLCLLLKNNYLKKEV